MSDSGGVDGSSCSDEYRSGGSDRSAKWEAQPPCRSALL
jgi:hypothetical protein